jgi:hypothetical protein
MPEKQHTALSALGKELHQVALYPANTAEREKKRWD